MPVDLLGGHPTSGDVASSSAAFGHRLRDGRAKKDFSRRADSGSGPTRTTTDQVRRLCRRGSGSRSSKKRGMTPDGFGQVHKEPSSPRPAGEGNYETRGGSWSAILKGVDPGDVLVCDLAVGSRGEAPHKWLRRGHRALQGGVGLVPMPPSICHRPRGHTGTKRFGQRPELAGFNRRRDNPKFPSGRGP